MSLVEQLGIAFGGRPHWGQTNTLTKDQVDQLYGSRVTAWREALVAVCGVDATFSNNYTRQRGLEPMDLFRHVVATKKDSEGAITHLCGNAGGWGRVSAQVATKHIESGAVTYYTQVDGQLAKVHVVRHGGTTYLRTDPDITMANNLDRLPDC